MREIKPRPVVKQGFGNIFATPGLINLRSHAPKPAAETNHQQPAPEPVISIRPSVVVNKLLSMLHVLDIHFLQITNPILSKNC